MEYDPVSQEDGGYRSARATKSSSSPSCLHVVGYAAFGFFLVALLGLALTAVVQVNMIDHRLDTIQDIVVYNGTNPYNDSITMTYLFDLAMDITQLAQATQTSLIYVAGQLGVDTGFVLKTITQPGSTVQAAVSTIYQFTTPQVTFQLPDLATVNSETITFRPSFSGIPDYHTYDPDLYRFHQDPNTVWTYVIGVGIGVPMSAFGGYACNNGCRFNRTSGVVDPDWASALPQLLDSLQGTALNTIYWFDFVNQFLYLGSTTTSTISTTVCGVSGALGTTTPRIRRINLAANTTGTVCRGGLDTTWIPTFSGGTASVVAFENDPVNQLLYVAFGSNAASVNDTTNKASAVGSSIRRFSTNATTNPLGQVDSTFSALLDTALDVGGTNPVHVFERKMVLHGPSQKLYLCGAFGQITIGSAVTIHNVARISVNASQTVAVDAWPQAGNATAGNAAIACVLDPTASFLYVSTNALLTSSMANVIRISNSTGLRDTTWGINASATGATAIATNLLMSPDGSWVYFSTLGFSASPQCMVTWPCAQVVRMSTAAGTRVIDPTFSIPHALFTNWFSSFGLLHVLDSTSGLLDLSVTGAPYKTAAIDQGRASVMPGVTVTAFNSTQVFRGEGGLNVASDRLLYAEFEYQARKFDATTWVIEAKAYV